MYIKNLLAKYYEGSTQTLSHIIILVFILTGLSMLQNAPMPRFLGEENLQEVFCIPEPTQCMLQLRNGLAELGIFQVYKTNVSYKRS